MHRIYSLLMGGIAIIIISISSSIEAATAFLGTQSTRSADASALLMTRPPRSSSTATYGGINELYSSEPPDPERRKQRLVYLSVSRKAPPQPKSEKEVNLDKQVWGRWKLVEESIDRPSNEDLAKYGAKLKPTYSKYEEDLLFDSFGSLMLTDHTTIGYGLGWCWKNFQDMYSAPTLCFRINRKGIGIDFDDFEDINEMPTMSFYSGTFLDGKMDTIEGVIQRNRDIRTAKGEPRIVVNVGKFTMTKVMEEEEEEDLSSFSFKEVPRMPRVLPPRKFSRFRETEKKGYSAKKEEDK